MSPFKPLNSQIVLRYLAILLMLYTTVFFALSALGNVAAYHAGWQMIHTTLTMRELPADAGASWRAVSSPLFSHVVFVGIYLAEFGIAVLAFIAAIKLWLARHKSSEQFQAAKAFAYLTIGLVLTLTFFAFLCIACQWFRMWMSPGYNGQAVFFQLTILYSVLCVLLIQIT